MASSIDGDVYIAGALTARRFNPPAGSITDASVLAGAGVAATKLEHQYAITLPLVNHATVVAAERRHLHYVSGTTGDVVAFGVLASVAAVGDSTATFDLYKNGSSILTGTFNLDSGDAAGALVTGTVSSAGLVTTDRLEVVVTVSAGTGTLPKGVAAYLLLREDAQ
jgi:hypothetical protein